MLFLRLNQMLFAFIIFLLNFTLTANEEFDLSDPDSIIQILAERRERIRETRATVCPDDSEFPGRYSHDPTYCKQGDIVLFAGINCLAAYLADDELTAKDRCRDVFNSQMSRPIENMDSMDGKWVRGEVALDNPTHFSRDMGLGVMAASVAEFFYFEDNPRLQERRDQLDKWLNYISRDPQNGKFMCKDSTPLGIGNRCNVYQGVGYGAQLYRILHTGGVVEYRGKKRKHRYKKEEFDNSQNKFEFSPKLKAKLLNKIRKKYHRYSPKKIGTELRFQFHDGYQIHLKTVELFIHLAMDRKNLKPNIFHKDNLVNVNYKEYNRLAKKIFKKSSVNPWHRLIYKGIDTDLLYSIMNQFCPVELAPKADHMLAHYSKTNYAWQSQEKNIGWEIGDGHDCIFLLNSLIANLKGNIEFGEIFDRGSCPKNKKKIGEYQTGLEPWDVCHYSMFDTSMTKCHSKAGVIRYIHPETGTFVTARRIVASDGGEPDFTKMQGQQAYCLEKKKGFYKARKINKVCGFGRNLIGYYNTKEQRSLWDTTLNISSVYSPHLYPICSPILKKKIRLSRCFNQHHILPIIEVLRGASIDESKDVSYCLVNKGSFFVKKDVNKNCPLGTKDTGKKKVAWRWPICKPWFAKEISVADCLKESPDHGHEQGYCIWSKAGYFKGRPLKNKNIADEDDGVANSDDERNNFETVPKNWTIQNNFSFNDFLDNVDPDEPVDIRMQGTLTWKTLGDRKGDYFYVKVFRLDGEEEVELINSQSNLPGLFENVEVLFNRSTDSFIRLDDEVWDGNYSLDYNLSLLYDTPHIDLKFKVYLVKVEDNGDENISLAYEHRQNVISRSNPILDQRKIIRVYPNPFNDLNEVKIDLLSNMINDSDQNNNTLYNFEFVLVDMAGREYARKTGPQLLNSDQTISPVFDSNPNLSPGMYILNIYLKIGKAYMGLYGSHQIIKF